MNTYLYVRIDVWKKMTKKRKQHPSQDDDASVVQAATRRVGRSEQGEARPAITAPRGRLHLDAGHSRLKTLSKSDFVVAKKTWATLSSMHFEDFPKSTLNTHADISNITQYCPCRCCDCIHHTWVTGM